MSVNPHGYLPYKKPILRWSWKIESLPSENAEDLLFNHDYMSIAVEFDNGQDITYHWSSELPIETIYRCPIPMWNKRETHIVIHSGKNGLGQWINEERNIYEDYKRAVGTPPQNIVRVWLIALNIFRRKEGKCDFANIKLVNSTDTIKIHLDNSFKERNTPRAMREFTKGVFKFGFYLSIYFDPQFRFTSIIKIAEKIKQLVSSDKSGNNINFYFEEAVIYRITSQFKSEFKSLRDDFVKFAFFLLASGFAHQKIDKTELIKLLNKSFSGLGYLIHFARKLEP